MKPLVGHRPPLLIPTSRIIVQSPANESISIRFETLKNFCCSEFHFKNYTMKKSSKMELLHSKCSGETIVDEYYISVPHHAMINEEAL